MAFVERKFVHHQATWLRFGQGVQLLSQAASLQLPNGVPVQAKQLGDVTNRQLAAPMRDRIG
ncbi:hypothetical protein D3C86_2073250 [compost metagenome]